VVNATPDRKLIKTVRAGDGFLAQSSKTIHFGFGPETEIERVDVRWPNGVLESFAGVTPNHRFRLVEGTGKAVDDAIPRAEVTLTATGLSDPGTTDQAEIRLSGELPMPQIVYQNFEAETVSIHGPRPTAVLLNLWASWCRPCIAELREFAVQHERLRTAGVEVVALSVDALQAGSTPAGADQRLLKQVGYSFSAGTASASTVDKLQFMHDFLVDRHRPLPVPSSFLIDRAGKSCWPCTRVR
jgi:peroxiredoxin